MEVLCELVRAWRRGACLMDPATHGRCSTAPQRTGSTSGRQAQAALFSLVRYVNSYVRARSALVPAVRRCGGFERAQRPARPRGDARTVGRRAPHTRGGCRACARNRTLTAREIRHQRDDRTHHVSNSPTLILILNHFGTSDVSG